MAFLYLNRNIPDEAHQKIGQMGPNGVSVFAFTPNNGWVIVTKERAYFARGIPDECFRTLGEFINAGDDVRVIAFTPSNGWVIVTDRNYFARGIPDECFQKVGEFFAAGAPISCIAFPPTGGNSWVILAGNSLYARNISDECYQYLCNCLPSTRPARQVAFAQNGGWAILAEDYYWAINIPGECFEQLGSFIQAGFMLDHLAFSLTGGWSIVSNTTIPSRPNDTIRQIEGTILLENGRWQSISDRMASYHVPGVSVAVVLDNRVAWACSYGRLEGGRDDFVHTETVFQAASISKPVSALGFLRQVQDGRITLDEDVNPHLTWNLPRCASAKDEWTELVTLRRLLQHNGGISGRGVPDANNQCNNFGGFGGYPNVGGVQIPTLDQVLDGSNPANSPPIQLTYEPGTAPGGYYSGPGYVLMMRLLQDLTGLDFGAWMRDQILQPSGMSNSTFEMTLPADLARAAAGHDSNGNVIPGKRNRYPEASAAGLYTTPTDLCRFIILLNQHGTIDGRIVLDGNHTDTMVDQATGIFTVNQVGAPDFYYWHNGGNAGFRCLLKGFPNRRAGVVVMTNGDSGDSLHNEIAQAIIRAYGWE